MQEKFHKQDLIYEQLAAISCSYDFGVNKKIGGTETNLTLIFVGLNANTIKGAKIIVSDRPAYFWCMSTNNRFHNLFLECSFWYKEKGIFEGSSQSVL